MFSGIVAAVGRITQLTPREAGFRLTVEAGGLDLSDVALGDSIAHAGVCLTVVDKGDNWYCVDVSPETFSCTVGLKCFRGCFPALFARPPPPQAGRRSGGSSSWRPGRWRQTSWRTCGNCRPGSGSSCCLRSPRLATAASRRRPAVCASC